MIGLAKRFQGGKLQVREPPEELEAGRTLTGKRAIWIPLHATGFLCERTDHDAFIGDIFEQVKLQIETASFLVADVTGANPNVLLEVGYAWGKGRPTILITQDPQILPFDIRGQHCLTYNSQKIKELEHLLIQEITALKDKQQLKA